MVAVDLPVDDDACGLSEYTSVALDAIGARENLTIVAQSMAAFTAPMIAVERPVDRIVLVAPMVPAPGESPGAWWSNTGQPEAARAFAIDEGRDPDKPFDAFEIFLHDVDPAVAIESGDHVLAQSSTPFDKPWPLDAWPDVTTECLVARHDRLFPLEFQRRIVPERLGIVPDEIDSGHLPALSQPAELTRRLLAYCG